jgi:hypothetical protein
VELEQKRAAVLAVYPNSVTWRHRVEGMTPEQVTAIYLRFEREGRLK